MLEKRKDSNNEFELIGFGSIPNNKTILGRYLLSQIPNVKEKRIGTCNPDQCLILDGRSGSACCKIGNRKCFFISDNRCSIHSITPLNCRIFPRSSDDLTLVNNCSFSFIQKDVVHNVNSLNGTQQNEKDFVEAIKGDLQNGIKHNKTSVEKLASTFGIIAKNDIKEFTELAIVQIARELAQEPGRTMKQRFDSIVQLYHNQVNLSHRTSRSILLQQYSTPAPIAYMMGMYVASASTSSTPKYFEPSAGNGLLTISVDPKLWDVNEIDEIRLHNLEQQGFNKVTSRNAAEKLIYGTNPRTYDGVITNPPFGQLGEPLKIGGFLLDELDHVMAAYALENMKDSGKAAIIVGGHINYDPANGRIKQQGEKGGNRNFYNYLYRNYNVDDVVYINGDLYSRQGTSFNVRLILINGRKSKPEGFAPRQTDEMNQVVNTWDEFYKIVSGNITVPVVNKDIPMEKQVWEMSQVYVMSNKSENDFPVKSKVEIVNGKPVYTTSTTVKWGNVDRTFEVSGRTQPRIEKLHKKIIEQALSEGKTVPEKVLADYPDLKISKPNSDIRNLMVYARFKGEPKYGAMDILKGTQVGNLLYASLIPSTKLDELITFLNEAYALNPDVNFKIVEAGKEKILFTTENQRDQLPAFNLMALEFEALELELKLMNS